MSPSMKRTFPHWNFHRARRGFPMPPHSDQVPIRTAAIADPTGDTLDAILCALQSAWSHRTTNPLGRIPDTADKLEGWIVDPCLLSSHPA